MVHETRHFSDGGLFVQSLLWIIFGRKTWYYWQNLIGYNNFLLYNKQKLLGLYIFLKIASIVKRCLVKVTITAFLFREVEQLAVYQLLTNLAVWEDFGWLSSGSEPVSMRGLL